MADLNAESKYPHVFDRRDILSGWQNDKLRNILTYRDQNYQSKYTDEPTPKHHSTFMEALNDSFDSYCGDQGKNGLRMPKAVTEEAYRGIEENDQTVGRMDEWPTAAIQKGRKKE